MEFIAITKEAGEKAEFQEIFELAAKRHVQVREIKETQLERISGTVHSQGIIAVINQNDDAFNPGSFWNAKLIVVCDRISDPGNLGTILRTCDWFGVDAVLLNEDCVSVYNEKVIRSTAGSIFHLKIYEDIVLRKALADLKSADFKIVATAAGGKSVFTAAVSGKTVLLLGNEAHGLDPGITALADEVLGIPRIGSGESLNAGVACGIFLAKLTLD
jgi:TrmH family RNA methyltransferase